MDKERKNKEGLRVTEEQNEREVNRRRKEREKAKSKVV